MDIQTFKSGVVKKLLVRVGDEVPVKSVIAIIDTNSKVKSEKLKMKNEEEKKVESETLKVKSEKENSQNGTLGKTENSELGTQNSELTHPSTPPPIHPLSRSILKEDKLLTYLSSNISVAVSRDDGLYMCVIKEAEEKSLEEINEWLKEIKTKRLTLDDLSGSTFGISNLGMFNVKRFNALINDKDSGIAAFGAMIENKIKVTFTIDHRILNGVNAAKFVNDFKAILKEI